MARGKKGEPVDRHKALADELRKKNGVEWRDAVMADQRVEFIRGKDFSRWFQANQEKLTGVTAAGRTDARIKELGDIFLRKRLFMKAERMFKKPKPGKKRLVKFPKKLIPLYQDATFQEDYFYAWQYERETSPWLYFFSGLVVVGVIAACLFPLAPYWLRLTVVYSAMALLCLIFVILVVRSIIALVSWVAAGRTLWLFPYLLADDKGITEAFWPIFELEKVEEGKGSQWWLRAIFAIVLGLCVYGSVVYAPDTGQVRDATKHAHDAILEMFNLDKAGMSKLGSGAANESAPGKPARGPAGAGAAPGQNAKPGENARPGENGISGGSGDSDAAPPPGDGDGQDPKSEPPAASAPPPAAQDPEEAEL